MQHKTAHKKGISNPGSDQLRVISKKLILDFSENGMHGSAQHSIKNNNNNNDKNKK